MIIIGYFTIYTIFNILYLCFDYARLYSGFFLVNNQLNNNKMEVNSTIKVQKKNNKSSFYVYPRKTLKIKGRKKRKIINTEEGLNSEKNIIINNKINNNSIDIKGLDIINNNIDIKGLEVKNKLSRNRINNKKQCENNVNNEKFINNKKEIDIMSVNIINKNCYRKSIKKEKAYLTEQSKNKKSILSYFRGNNFSDFELNDLPYSKAVDYDKRSFFNYYLQLIRREHLILFTFFAWDDYNILAIKLSKFMFSIALDFAFNVVFFFDESMHKIYLDYGKYNFIAQIPQILYSTIVSESLDVLLRYLALTEKDIYRIIKLKNNIFSRKKIFKILRCIKIKIFFYFLVSFIFICLFWYYISAFCAVYKNTQIFLIKDSMTSLLISLLYPFGLYLIPTALRIISLRDKKKRLNILYKLSDIIPII